VRAAILIAALGLAGCTLGDERVSKSCTKAADCFQAQGEFCNTTTNECEVMPDAGALETEDLTTEAELEAEAHHE
jgi:hypothetical protein